MAPLPLTKGQTATAETSAGTATTAETAVEVMVATSAVRNLIREGKTFQLPNAIQTGSQHGMQTLDQALSALFRANMVTPMRL